MATTVSRCCTFALLWAAALAVYAAPFDIAGTGLTVTSGNLVATFRGAEVVGIVNQLTGESYLRAPTAATLVDLRMTTATANALAPLGNWTLDAAGTSATLTFFDSTRNVTLAVSVDPGTQEVVVVLDGHVNQGGGVQSIAWGLTGFDLALGRFVLPASGGVSLTAKSFAKRQAYEFAVGNPVLHWEAPLSLFQTAQGGVALYSTDLRSQFKSIELVANQNETANQRVFAEAPGPWSAASSAGPVQWRLAAYRGDWQAGARIYRDWRQATPAVQTARPEPAWVDQIRTVVRFAYTPPYDIAMIDLLAKDTTPAQTLIYIPNWRVDAYDVNYPDYSPVASLAAVVARAQALGFRVMLHTDMVGVSPSNPDFAALAPYQARNPLTLEAQGWIWNLPPETPGRFAYINPAASAYRMRFVQRLTPVMQAVRPDALHLDISGLLVNDGNGLIEGMNYNEGAARLHRDLMAAFPNVVLGGEGTNDTIAPYQGFSQQPKWPPQLNPDETPPVPISAYVLPKVRPYGHLAVLNPDEAGFLKWFQQYEGQALLPTYGTPYYIEQQRDLTQLDWARYKRLALAFQQHGLRPAWDTAWNGAVVQYQGAAGAQARLTDSGTLVQFALQQTSDAGTVYQRVHAANQIDSAFNVPAWPAYTGSIATGLDPAIQYWLDPAPRDAGRSHIVNLRSGVKLGVGAATLATPEFAYYRMLPVEAPVPDLFDAFFHATSGITRNGVDSPLSDGALAFDTTMVVGGSARRAIFTHPPINAPGAETFVEYALTIPDAYSATLSFAVGILDSAIPGRKGPMTFRVAVNGSTLWQQDVTTGAWREGTLDLGAYAGQLLALRLVANPGPSNDASFAQGGWSGLSLDLDRKSEHIAFTLAGPVPASLAHILTTDGAVALGGGGASISDFSVGGSVLAFLKEPVPVAIAQSLLDLPFIVSQSSDTELAGPTRVPFTGYKGSFNAGGLVKSVTVWGDAPFDGQTILSWPVKLPAASPLLLSLSTGLRNDADPLPQGIGVQVRVNGATLWRNTLHRPSAWKNIVVDLSPWSGQYALVELVSDSLGQNGAHWSAWAELSMSTTAANPCGTTLNRSGPIATLESGATGQVAIAAAAGCTWSAESEASWIKLAPASGAGAGTVTYTLPANHGPAREASIAIAGHRLAVTQAARATPAPTRVIEYYHAGLDHYFITWVPDEIAKLDAGIVIRGWVRTGQSFNVFTAAQPGSSPVCRYYIPPGLGNSHFFGRGASECAATGAHNPSFVLEDPAFMQVYLPNGGTCPAASTPVYRVFSNRPDANHRYMTDRGVRDQMTGRGWLAEGDGPDLVVMCAPG
jgi:Domain of unknown function (DUF6259)